MLYEKNLPNCRSVGIDLMEIDELSKLLTRRWFLEYVYDNSELEICEHWEPQRKNEFLTGRFCAKEAVYKAIPHSRKLGIKPNEIIITRDDDRSPKVEMSNLSHRCDIKNVSISITHKGNVCASVAIVD